MFNVLSAFFALCIFCAVANAFDRQNSDMSPHLAAERNHINASSIEKLSNAQLLQKQADEIDFNRNVAQLRAADEHAAQIRKAITAPWPYGKDCRSAICQPYLLCIDKVYWGHLQTEEINAQTNAKYENASKRATSNLQREYTQFQKTSHMQTNVISGLPNYFTFYASNWPLSVIKKFYWFWPHIIDPNQGFQKHGMVVYHCKDSFGNKVKTVSQPFDEYDTVELSCNDIATLFAQSVGKK
jgi:hypothetical protein